MYLKITSIIISALALPAMFVGSASAATTATCMHKSYSDVNTQTTLQIRVNWCYENGKLTSSYKTYSFKAPANFTYGPAVTYKTPNTNHSSVTFSIYQNFNYYGADGPQQYGTSRIFAVLNADGTYNFSSLNGPVGG